MVYNAKLQEEEAEILKSDDKVAHLLHDIAALKKLEATLGSAGQMDDRLNYEVMKTLEDVIQDLTGHPNLEIETLVEAWLADCGCPVYVMDNVMKLKEVWDELADEAEFEDPQILKNKIESTRKDLESDVQNLLEKMEVDVQKATNDARQLKLDDINQTLNSLPETGTTTPSQNQTLKTEIGNLMTDLSADPNLDPLTITESSLKAKG